MLSMTSIRILFSKYITFTRFIKHEKFGNYEQKPNLVEAGGKACERKEKEKKKNMEKHWKTARFIRQRRKCQAHPDFTK